MPILERGRGEAPSSHLDDARQRAFEKGYVNDNDKSEPFISYWGACSYTVQFGDQMKNDGIGIHLASGRIIKASSETKKLQMDSDQAREQWSKVTGGDSDSALGEMINQWFGPSEIMAKTDTADVSLPKQLYSSHALPYVVPFYQSGNPLGHGDNYTWWADPYDDCVGSADDPWSDWDGCSPISGAMVLGYYSNIGYTAIPDPDVSTTEDILIDHCHYWMGTDFDGWTSVGDIASGMRLVTEEVYEYTTFTGILDGSYSWTDVKNEINNGYPFVLNMQDAYLEGEYIDHSVCVYGYLEDGATHDIRCYNTWDTDDDYYITEYNWNSASLSELHP